MAGNYQLNRVRKFATSDSTPAVLDNASLTFLAATPNSTQLLSLAPLTVPVTLDPTGAATSPVATAALLQQEWALGH